MDVRQIRDNRAAWEAIAQSFHTTRNKPWDAVENFLDDLPDGARILDAGCGNGRHGRLMRGRLRPYGFDLSRSLLKLARTHVGDPHADWIEGILERLPFRPGSFDAAIATAALHHVRGHAHRVATIQGLLRTLKTGGRLLLSVWSREQPRFGPGKEPRAPRDDRPTEPGDALVKWTHHRQDVDRYIHLYTWTEWRRELDSTHARIERAWPEAIMTEDEPDNFFAILRNR